MKTLQLYLRLHIQIRYNTLNQKARLLISTLMLHPLSGGGRLALLSHLLVLPLGQPTTPCSTVTQVIVTIVDISI